MFEAQLSRKHELECLRLQAECMQLAGDAQGYTVQSHFVHMAKCWLGLALAGPDAVAGSEPLKAQEQMT
jgi:hypothetical protein